LVIVGPVEITTEAKAYLEFLRTNFNVPVHYECHVVKVSVSV